MSGLFDYLYLLTPQLLLLSTALVALVAELFLAKRFSSITHALACVGLLVTAVWSYVFIGQPSHAVLSGLLISDDVTHTLNLFILIVVLWCYIYSKASVNADKIPEGEYYVLGLLSTVGMMTLVSAHHLLTLYLGLELLSLPLYAMTAMARTQVEGPEAAMKYFVMGSVASAMLLYGMSLLFGATGQLDFASIAQSIAAHSVHENTLLLVALVFIVVGLGFKLAAVPFHMWAPDVYEGAPTVVTLFIGAAPKIAAIGMTLRILTDALPGLVDTWQQLILVMALLSTGVGNLLAVVQPNIKRLFAYSTISHMGYALFGVLAGTASGYAAAMYYVIVYALMSCGALGLLVLLSRQGVAIQQVDDLRGLNRRNPWLAFLMMVILFSMAGVPPTVGFFAKLLVLKALVDVHQVWVAVMGLLFAVLGAFYSLRIIKVMYFDEATQSEAITLSRLETLAFSLNGLSLLYFGFFPSVLMVLCLNAVTH